MNQYKKAVSHIFWHAQVWMIPVDSEVDRKHIFENNLRSCSSTTAPYEKVMEESGKRYMVLKIGANDKVHSYGVRDQELCFDDVDGKFVILDGLAYMSDNDETTVYYLEV